MSSNTATEGHNMQASLSSATTKQPYQKLSTDENSTSTRDNGSSHGATSSSANGGGGGPSVTKVEANTGSAKTGIASAGASTSNTTGTAKESGSAAAATYFPSQEVAIGTLIRSFIVDGVFRDHFPQLSPSSTALPQGEKDKSGAEDTSQSATASGSALVSSSKVNVNEDGSTSHPPISDDALLSQADLLTTQAVARDLLQSLRQPADVPLYTRCSAYPNTKRRLLCHPDLSPEEIRSTVPPQYLALFAVDVPAISLTAFSIRLVQRMHCGIDAFVWAIGLMFRVSSKIPVCSRSVHRMLLAASVISAKCRNDIYYSMSFYSGVGGVARNDLRAMEVAMLTALDFTAYLTPRTYVDLLYSMRQHCAQLTHTYKKAWASEAWAAFIVSVPLAHQAAFDPQAIVGPPPTPPHLRRDLIVIPARTKPYRNRDGTLRPAAPPPAERDPSALPSTAAGKEKDASKGAGDDVGSDAKRPKTTSAGQTNISSNSPSAAVDQSSGVGANIGISRDGRFPQGPAGSAFTALNNQTSGASGVTTINLNKKGTYAYFAATGDTGSAAGTSTDDESSRGGATVKVYTSQHQTRHPGQPHHPNAPQAQAVSVGTSHPAVVQQVALNPTANHVAPIAIGGDQMRQGHQNQHQFHPHRQAGLQPITMAGGMSQQNVSPAVSGGPSAATFSHHHNTGAHQQQHVVRVTSPVDDVRSMHSSLQSFGDLAGDISNSDASVNMRVVGMGPIVRAVTNNSNIDSTGAALDRANSGEHAAQGGGHFFTGTAHPSAVGAGGVMNANNQPNLMGVAGGGVRTRYAPSANTSMNSFSDYTSSSGSHHGGGGVSSGHPRPTVVNVAHHSQPTLGGGIATADASHPAHQQYTYQQQQQQQQHHQVQVQQRFASGVSSYSNTSGGGGVGVPRVNDVPPPTTAGTSVSNPMGNGQQEYYNTAYSMQQLQQQQRGGATSSAVAGAGVGAMPDPQRQPQGLGGQQNISTNVFTSNAHQHPAFSTKR